jgi:hypothetical protein
VKTLRIRAFLGHCGENHPRILLGSPIEKPAKPFDKKGKVILAIHSPAVLFAGDEEAPGKTYSFNVFGNMRDGRPEFYAAEAQENTSPEKKKP